MILKDTLLKADSKKNAFYRLKIEKIRDGYLIQKESGINDDKVLHRETYYRNNYDSAFNLYSKKIKEKTNPKRKRVYRIVLDLKPVQADLF